MPKQALKLTERALKALKPGEWRADGAVQGLLARRHRQGVSFAFRYQWAGKRRIMVIGEWETFDSLLQRPADAVQQRLRPDADERLQAGADPADLIEIVIEGGTPLVTLDEARDIARELRARLKRGQDPAAAAKADWRLFTLAEALALYLGDDDAADAKHRKQRSPRTVTDYRSKIDRNLGDWKQRPLASLSHREVYDRHREIGRRAPYDANGTMRVLRAVYNRARKIYPDLPANPCDAVDWYPERRREAAIPSALLPQWWREVEALKNPVRRDLYKLMLLTGLRRETAVSIRLEDIDLEARTLRVPRPKGGEARAFTIPLSDALVRIIRERIADNEASRLKRNEKRLQRRQEPFPASPWLFPANSASGHVSEPKPGVRDGFSVPFTPHGLRHTYISAATAAGVHPYQLKLLTNHALPRSDVTAGYVRADVEALRPAQERITALLLELLEARPGNVVRLEAAAAG